MNSKSNDRKNFMMNCKEVMKKLSTKEELTFFQKMDLNIHILICRGCTRFKKQLQAINASVKDLISSEMKFEEIKVKKMEENIISKIQK